MRMKLTTVLAAVTATGITMGSAAAGEFRTLTQACEEALALSAIPADLRERASVYVWRGTKFERTIASQGGFHCLVERNHADAIIPQCVTESGADSILPGLMFRTEKAAAGLSPDDVAKLLDAKFADGSLKAPREPGVNYMMSAFNYIYTQPSGAINRVGPHTMFFAPNTTNEKVGGSFQVAVQNPGFPFVLENNPHGYMITFTKDSAETADVEKHCAGQFGL